MQGDKSDHIGPAQNQNSTVAKKVVTDPAVRRTVKESLGTVLRGAKGTRPYPLGKAASRDMSHNARTAKY